MSKKNHFKNRLGEPVQKVCVSLPEDLHKSAKIAAILLGQTLSEFCNDALEAYSKRPHLVKTKEEK